MRRVYLAWLVLLAIGLALTSTVGLGQGTPRPGGTLVIATGADVVTLDPLRMTDVRSGNFLAHIAESLFTLSPAGELIPVLATGYEISPDGLTLTIKLRTGVKFHDGTPFNAGAVKLNLDRFRKDATFKFLIDAIGEITVVDDSTLRLQLARPFAPILRGLAHTFTAILSPTAIAAGKVEPVGTGPFVFVEWVRGDRAVVARNPHYWGQPAYLDRVVFRPVLEPGTRVMMLLAGEADLILDVPADDVRVIQADPNCRFVRGPSLTVQYLGLNNLRGPFKDPRVRQAINYAINKEEIIKAVLGGYATVAAAPIPPAAFGHFSVGPYPYDPERAQALLAAAGYPRGFKTTLRFNPGWRETAAELIQAQLRKVGIEVELIRMEWGAYLDFTARPAAESEVDMFLLGWVTVTMDADYGLYGLFHSTQWPPMNNRAFYSNPKVDELLDKARAEFDPNVRLKLYQEAIGTIWKDAPWCFLHYPDYVNAERANVYGVVHHPNLYVLAHLAWKR